MLVNFDPPGICLRDGDRFFSPPGSVLLVVSVRGSIYWFPRTALGGTESHVTPATMKGVASQCGHICKHILQVGTRYTNTQVTEVRPADRKRIVLLSVWASNDGRSKPGPCNEVNNT